MIIDRTAVLRSLGRKFPEQWQLQVEISGYNETLKVDQCLRLLPGRRIAVGAEWKGRRVFAKVFFGGKARTEYQHELSMIERMAGVGISAPELLSSGVVAGGAFVLISEFLENAIEFQMCWRQQAAEKEKENLFKQLVTLQLELYQADLYQSDAHLGNYVKSSERLLVLDAGGVKRARFRRRAKYLHNLALLVAQFDWREHDKLAKWAVECLSTIEGPLTGCSYEEFQGKLVKTWRRRLRKASDKSLRSCSKVLEERNPGLHVFCRRKYGTKELLQNISNRSILDQLIEQGDMLKQGNSATVAKTRLDGHFVVIKRYNLKNRWIAFKRLFQVSRARRSWYNAHLLELMNFNTPEPIALIEEKVGWFSQRAYLITSWSQGKDFGCVIDAGEENVECVDFFSDLFQGMCRARISHGDMKATNFIIENESLGLIDLDSMRFHRLSHSFEKRLKKDVGRFLANWKRAIPEQFKNTVAFIN